jgi:hypothetical protein
MARTFLESIPLTAAVWKLRVPRAPKSARCRWEIHALVIAPRAAAPHHGWRDFRSAISTVGGSRVTTETEKAETLPKTLPGVVCAQWRKCGKAGCRCARGTLHGPYFYRFWRHDGRLHKAYVRKADVEGVRGRCLARRQDRAEWLAAMQQVREMASFLKDLERP